MSPASGILLTLALLAVLAGGASADVLVSAPLHTVAVGVQCHVFNADATHTQEFIIHLRKTGCVDELVSSLVAVAPSASAALGVSAPGPADRVCVIERAAASNAEAFKHRLSASFSSTTPEGQGATLPVNVYLSNDPCHP